MTITFAKSDLKELTQPRFLFWSFFIMALYSTMTLLLPNVRLLSSIIISNEVITEKLSYLIGMVIGSYFSYNGSELLLLLVTGFLIGINVTLWLSRRRPSLVSAPLLSGQSLAGVISSGCSSCGSTILSAISSTVGIGIAPLHLLLIQVLTIIFLLISFVYTLQKKTLCPIPSRS